MKKWILGGALAALGGAPVVRAGLDEVDILIGLVIKDSFEDGAYRILGEHQTNQLKMEAPEHPDMPVTDVQTPPNGVVYTAVGGAYEHVITHFGPNATYGLRDPATGQWVKGPFPITPD